MLADSLQSGLASRHSSIDFSPLCTSPSNPHSLNLDHGHVGIMDESIRFGSPLKALRGQVCEGELGV